MGMENLSLYTLLENAKFDVLYFAMFERALHMNVDVLQPNIFLIDQKSNVCIAGKRFLILSLLKVLGL